ncbi:hypothetical protein VTK26DRAFT_311 [Humicola hyalothermophila]
MRAEGCCPSASKLSTNSPHSIVAFRVYGGLPADTISKLRGSFTAVQILELHFCCFCKPSSVGDNVEHLETISAKPRSSYGVPSDPNWDHDVIVSRHMDTWPRAMRDIQAHLELQELQVTLSSCCRYVADEHRGRSRETYPEDCRMLEGHFLRLLEGCRQVRQLTLAGVVW